MVVLIVVLVFIVSQLYILGSVSGIGPLSFLKTFDKEVKALAEKHPSADHQGEIMFYGASNFRLWESMNEDTKGYRTLNHGFGGCSDKDLIHYSETLLYPYNPSIIILQTGSNDYITVKSAKSERVQVLFEQKKKMYEDFHHRLPKTPILVCAGILMSGRQQFSKEIMEMNRLLKDYCEQTDYLTYIDSEELSLKDGIPNPECFIRDGIHFKPEMRVLWWNKYIQPAVEKVIQDNHIEGVKE